MIGEIGGGGEAEELTTDALVTITEKVPKLSDLTKSKAITEQENPDSVIGEAVAFWHISNGDGTYLSSASKSNFVGRRVIF